MDKRINKKLESYISEFKNNIRSKADELEITNIPNVEKLLTYVYEYDRLTFIKEDFMKRKRNKTGISVCERCTANRSNGEQCTRRKKIGHEFCGTHTKGIPHGICSQIDIPQETKINKIEVRVQDINGIMYFIDLDNNVYQTEDVLKELKNPKIIGKCVTNNNGEFSVLYKNEL
jgi:hypothetical protein